jgi:nifR3 family TIM-barrel protein
MPKISILEMRKLYRKNLVPKKDMTRRYITLAGKKIQDWAVLAPMANVTEIAYRIACKRQGVAFVFTEFVSAHALARGIRAAQQQAKTAEEEQPVILQIFGESADIMVKAAQWAEKQGCYAGLDINIGCPSPKITQAGAGAMLLDNLPAFKEICHAVKRSVRLPVSVKMRIGIDEHNITAPKVADIAQTAGISFMTVHPRTLAQKYRGEADWGYIKSIRNRVSIPVIGNGDVVDGPSAKAMIEQTGCDYVMVGRAARGNPFIFNDINGFLGSGKRTIPSREEKLAAFFSYLTIAKQYGVAGQTEIRQKAMAFTRGIEGGKRLREQLATMKDVDCMLALLQSC